VTKAFDYARVYYWRIQLFEPDDPDDERYVLLRGEEGEIAGPMTVPQAQDWMNRHSRGPRWCSQRPSQK